MFIKLLVRATKEDAADAKVENLPGAEEVPATGLDESGRFDPLRVSEMVWVKWRDTARRPSELPHGHRRAGSSGASLARIPSQRVRDRPECETRVLREGR